MKLQRNSYSARFGSTYTKIGTIQRRLAWPLREDDIQKFVKRTIFLLWKKDSLFNKRCWEN